MKRFSKLTLALSGFIILSNTAFAALPHKGHNPSTFVGPIFGGSFTNNITDISAYSVSGEAGPNNYRIDTSVGIQFFANQRFKLSAEYLWQDLRYGFATGNTQQWVNQGALGADYQIQFPWIVMYPTIGMSGYYAHAPSKTLHGRLGSFINDAGVFELFVNKRRIAGSTSSGAAPGITIQPWCGGKVGADLNYDHVSYETKYSHSQDAMGLGGTFRFDQTIRRNFGIGVVAEVRKPFNNYSTNFSWNNIPYHGVWSVGVMGEYTAGKNRLPSTYAVGFSANYFLDQRCDQTPAEKYYAENFLAWTAKPTVYMPQVLTIRDESDVTT